jgi:uncharacterized membrane protein
VTGVPDRRTLDTFSAGRAGPRDRLLYATVPASLALPEAAGRTLAAFVSLVGFGFSGWLTYVELAKLDAVCQWCVASALVMTALAAVSVARLLRGAGRAVLAA